MVQQHSGALLNTPLPCNIKSKHKQKQSIGT
jgi:hypothetical protein